MEKLSNGIDIDDVIADQLATDVKSIKKAIVRGYQGKCWVQRTDLGRIFNPRKPLLNEAGIIGIKYLNGMSRSKGEGITMSCLTTRLFR